MKGLPDSVVSRGGPAHTCISEPLDKPRAFASSVVKPFLSVLLTVHTRGKFRKSGNIIAYHGKSVLFFCIILVYIWS